MVDTRQPVEIELTPAEPRREPRSARPVVSSGGSPGPSAPRRSPLSTERGRLVAVAACVGLLALLVGWAAGRATGEEGATTPATTTAAERVIAETTVREEVIEPPATTRPPTRRTTTTLPAFVAQTMTGFEIAEPLVGMPVTIVGVDRTGQYVELDLATGVLELRQLGGRVGAADVRVGPGWALVMPQDDTRVSWLIADEADLPVEVDVGPSWDVVSHAGSSILWRTTMDGGLRVVEAIRPDGSPTGETFELPDPFAYLSAADPRGGLVVDMPGGIYRLSGDGAELLTTGRIFALSAEWLVSYECDLQAECDLHVTDRNTGERRVVDVVDVNAMMPAWGEWALSPDGTQVLVQLVSAVDTSGYSTTGVGLVDLDDGTVLQLGQTGYRTSVGWSPDGRYVFHLGGVEVGGMSGALVAHDRETGVEMVVAENLPSLVAFAVRPAADVSGG